MFRGLVLLEEKEDKEGSSEFNSDQGDGTARPPLHRNNKHRRVLASFAGRRTLPFFAVGVDDEDDNDEEDDSDFVL